MKVKMAIGVNGGNTEISTSSGDIQDVESMHSTSLCDFWLHLLIDEVF